MQEPERAVATLPITDRSLASIEALRPTLQSMRWALKAQLHAAGWQSVPLTDIKGKMYFVGSIAHLVVMHRPTGIDGVLVGGAEDGAQFPVEGSTPALTVGMVSGTDPDDYYGCDCYSCDSCDTPDETEAWTCWRLAGLIHNADDGWRWAYTSAASYGIERQEQRLHDLGTAHSARTCSLCKLENWMRKTSKARLPRTITSADATLHVEGAPHATTFCTGCAAGLEMRSIC
ncbi:hypothetical protein QF031_000959 [Pseudarthrobacter defluvii]|nr:hypothetical protein [Pseudarthrobacter defluvii]